MAKVPVRFLQRHDLYNGGEIAGFSEEQSEKYVADGIAEYLTANVERAPVVKVAQAPAISQEEKPKRKRGRPRKKKPQEVDGGAE